MEYCHSVLLIRKVPEVTSLIRTWEVESTRMAERQAEHEKTGKPPRIPPRFNPPVILEDVVRVHVHENQASTSWVAKLDEVEDRLESYIEKFARDCSNLPNADEAYHSGIAEMLRSQEDTWLGLLLARDYPSMAHRFLLNGIPKSMTENTGRDKSHAFDLDAGDSASASPRFSNPSVALKAFLEYAKLLIQSEGGPSGEFRIRYPHIQRRILVFKKDQPKEYISLARNGAFILPGAETQPKISANENAELGRWTRRKPNRDTFIRLGKHEICRLSKESNRLNTSS